MSSTPRPGQARSDLEAELRSALASYQVLVDHIPQRAFIKNRDSIYLAVNKPYAADIGLTPEQMIGRDDHAFHPPELAEKYRSDDARVMASGAVLEFDEGYSRSGRDRTIHTVKTPIRDAAGSVIALCGIFWDVTEQRELERRLSESEATLRAIYDKAQEGILLARVDGGRFVMANPAICRMLGYDEAELLSMGPLDLHPAEMLPRVRKVFARFELGDFSLVQGLPFRRKSGEILYADVSPMIVTLKGQPCYLAVLRDVTEQRAAREQLARNEALLAEAQAIAHLGNWNLDLRSGQASWSDEEFRLFGFAPGSVQASAELFKACVHPDDYPRVYASVQAAIRSGDAAPYHTEFRVPRPDGERVLEERGRVERDAAGQPLRIYGTTLDVTEQRHAAQALRQLNEELEQRVRERTAELLSAKQEAERANAAKSEFLSRMSHELRTPLNAILGFGQLLSMQPGGPTQLDYANEIVKAGGHLLELINEVLDLARIESGKLSVACETVALAPLLAGCMTLLRPQAQARGLTLVEACGEPRVWADPMRLRQVLLNLLSNAIKYNRPGGLVSLLASTEADALRIDVVDTGPGLDAQAQARLFVPFERLAAAHSTVEGAGIGLAISKRLVELMGGSLGVDSEPGKGSCFWFRLPLPPGS